MGLSTCVVLASLLFTLDLAEYKTYTGYRVYRVTPETSQHVHVLKDLEHQPGYDFWKTVRAARAIDVSVPPEQISSFEATLRSHQMAYRVSVADLAEVVRKEKKERLARRSLQENQFNYSSYHTLEEIHSWMFDMAVEHSSLLSVIRIGQSYEGRTLLAFKMSTGHSKEKQVIWLDGGIHAREWVSPATIIYFVQQFMEHYGVDEEITWMLDTFDWYILPVFNVDGYAFTHNTTHGDRYWRKTRRPNKGSSCIGTDPNRNWDHSHWGTVGVSYNPCSSAYCGPYAFSEIEVKQVADFLAHKEGRVAAFLSYHSYTQLYMLPYGFTHKSPPDYALLKEVGDRAVAAVYSVHGKTYNCDSLNRVVGLNSGSSADYTYDVLNIKYSFGIELRDTGEYGFALPANQIIPTGEENMAALKVIVRSVGGHDLDLE